MKSAASFLVCLLVASGVRAQTVQNDVTFSEPSPLSGNAQIVQRSFTPIEVQRIDATLAPKGQPFDISKEKYLLYVPSAKPPQGYALLVFIPPWEGAKIPEGWAAVLDEYGVIFVSATQSGNDKNVAFRRVPLALNAAYNLAKQYDVDPSRVFVGGFSGGSRTAMLMALEYPDVFRGALMNSGGDAIGNNVRPIPSRDLFALFRSQTHLVYLTGDEDGATKDIVRDSLQSMREWCVPSTHAIVMPHAEHETASGADLGSALQALLAPAPPDTPDLAACRAARDAELNTKLDQVDSLIAGGDKTSAQNLLNVIDQTYGGLAAPRSLALQAKLPPSAP
jgi:pimeloyl-ACP methyl ester carboxylesterase